MKTFVIERTTLMHRTNSSRWFRDKPGAVAANIAAVAHSATTQVAAVKAAVAGDRDKRRQHWQGLGASSAPRGAVRQADRNTSA